MQWPCAQSLPLLARGCGARGTCGPISHPSPQYVVDHRCGVQGFLLRQTAAGLQGPRMMPLGIVSAALRCFYGSRMTFSRISLTLEKTSLGERVLSASILL